MPAAAADGNIAQHLKVGKSGSCRAQLTVKNAQYAHWSAPALVPQIRVEVKALLRTAIPTCLRQRLMN